jgi:hypothetical protein
MFQTDRLIKMMTCLVTSLYDLVNRPDFVKMSIVYLCYLSAYWIPGATKDNNLHVICMRRINHRRCSDESRANTIGQTSTNYRVKKL